MKNKQLQYNAIREKKHIEITELIGNSLESAVKDVEKV